MVSHRQLGVRFPSALTLSSLAAEVLAAGVRRNCGELTNEPSRIVTPSMSGVPGVGDGEGGAWLA